MTGRNIIDLLNNEKLASLLVLERELGGFYFYKVDTDGLFRTSKTYATEEDALEHCERWLAREV